MQGEVTHIIFCLKTAVENVKRLSIILSSNGAARPLCALSNPLVADEQSSKLLLISGTEGACCSACSHKVTDPAIIQPQFVYR